MRDEYVLFEEKLQIRRLGIFCFYDAEGIVDSYIEYLLDGLKKNLTTLIVVVNGYVNDDGRKKFEKYAKEIIIRENKGFDMGAYKDVVLNYQKNDTLSEWNEIVFCNDTFFGPLVSMDTIFSCMEKRQSDFWGLNFVEDGMFSHIQSFFLVFQNKSIIEDVAKYMSNPITAMLTETTNIADIYAVYELGLFHFLKQKGYRYATYANTESSDIYQSPDVCIRKYDLPILKKKCFSQKTNEGSLMRALQYINEKTNYNIALIQQNVLRQYGFKWNRECTKDVVCEKAKESLVDEKEILDFIEKNECIYIYGTGVYARKVWYLFHEKMKKFAGFMVSDDCSIDNPLLYGNKVYHYSEIHNAKAVIIGCDLTNTKEILLNLSEKEKVFVLWNCLKSKNVIIDRIENK